MRWLTFAIGAIIVLVMQSALAPRIAIAYQRPDWLLVLVILISFRAPIKDAVLAAWVLGLAGDLLTVERFGFLSLSYTIVAVLTLSIRHALITSNALTLGTVTLAAGLLLNIAWWGYRRATLFHGDLAWSGAAVEVLLPSAYTAVWALLLYHPFQGIAPWMAFRVRSRV